MELPFLTVLELKRKENLRCNLLLNLSQALQEKFQVPFPVTSAVFSVLELPQATLDIVYNEEFDSVINSTSMEVVFLSEFRALFSAQYPKLHIISLSIREGSIIVSLTLTASDTEQISSLVTRLATPANFHLLSFTFNSILLIPSNVTYEINFDAGTPSILEKYFVLILATVIPVGTMVIFLCLLLVVCCCLMCKRGKNKQLMITVTEPEKEVVENTFSPVQEFHLFPRKLDPDSFSFNSQDGGSQQEQEYIVSSSVDVDVKVQPVKMSEMSFSNPLAFEREAEENAYVLEPCREVKHSKQCRFELC